jgi:secretion/DNA translocation related CpaE-like protein
MTRAASAPAVGPTRPFPLLVTGDPQLLDEVLRLSAAAAVHLEVAADPGAARSGFATAPLVLLGGDLVAAALRARWPRRANLVVICRDAADPLPWSAAETLGAAHVALLPAAETWVIDRLVEAGAVGDAGLAAGKVLAVLGGRGGAGASVLAAGLAVSGSRMKLSTLLIDADPLGGGLDLLLGWEERHGVRWPQLARTAGRLEPSALVAALPGRGDLVVLSCARADAVTDDDFDADVERLPPDAMAAALDAGRRGRDLVVVDLPRQVDPAAALALRAADRVLLVVPAELRATAAAARVVAAVRTHRRDLALIVRGPSPGRLPAAEMARVLGLPLAGEVRSEPRLPAALERGETPAADGRGSLAALCRRLIRELAPA